MTHYGVNDALNKAFDIIWKLIWASTKDLFEYFILLGIYQLSFY